MARKVKTIAGVPLADVKRGSRKVAAKPAPKRKTTLPTGLPAPAFTPQEKKAVAKTKRAKAKVPASKIKTAPNLPPRGDITSPKQIPKAIRKDFVPMERAGKPGKPIYVPRAKAERISDRQKEEAKLRLLADRRDRRGTASPKSADIKIAGLNLDRLSGKAGRTAIDVIEQTTRPLHGIAGGARAAVQGHSPTSRKFAEAVSAGLSNEEKYTFSDVLKEAGVKNKTVAGIAGFAADVAFDPTTYLTFGTASVARNAASKAASKKVLAREVARKKGKLAAPAVKATGAGRKAERKTYRRALAEGKSKQEAQRLADEAALKRNVARQQRRTGTLDARAGRKAGKRAAAKAPDSHGLQVGFAGANTTIPIAPKLGRDPDRVTRTAREIGTTFSPHIRPAGVGNQEFRAVKGATREARAGASRGRERAIARAAAFANAIPPEKASEVIDAIERGTVYGLRDQGVRDAAQAIEREFRAARKAEIRAGVDTAAVSGPRYFAHMLDDALDAAKGKGGKAGTTIRASYGKQRQHRGTIAQIEAAGGPKFSKDVPTVIARRLSQSAQDVAKAKMAQAVGKAGRPVTDGAKVKPGEAVFEIAAGKVRALDPSNAADMRLRARVAAGESGAKLVILNKDFVEREVRGLAPAADHGPIRRAIDKTTGGFKYISTVPNPGFHLRNLYGDTQNAYLAQGGGKLVKNTAIAGRTLKALHRSEEGMRSVGLKRALGATTKVKDQYGRTQAISLEKLAHEAAQAGAIRQGFIERELPELWRANEAGVKKVKKGGKLSRHAGRLLQSREDIMRLATYIAARKDGLAAREAADRVARHHFDYGDLSVYEREVMRRLLPFYTFTARNVPLQAKSVLEKPGKFANVQKAREEIAKAQGIDLAEFESGLREFQLRTAPIPLRRGGEVFAISTALPLGDLNELPLPRDGKLVGPALDEWKDKFTAMLNPLFRTPIEISANHNYFFRGPIERDESPLVAAPAFVAALPAAARERLGAVPDYQDRRSGERMWGWPAKVDYAAKVLMPGPPGAIMRLSEEGESRRGQSRGAKALSYVGGVRADRVDPETAEIDVLFGVRQGLLKRRAELGQRGQGSADYGKRQTREYEQIKADLKKVETRITKLSGKRGDKRPLLQRPRPSSGFFGGSSDKQKFFDDSSEDEKFF